MSVHPSSPPSSPEMGEPPGPGGPGPRPIVALGFSPEAKALLLRLESSGLFGAIRWPGPAARVRGRSWPWASVPRPRLCC